MPILHHLLERDYIVPTQNDHYEGFELIPSSLLLSFQFVVELWILTVECRKCNGKFDVSLYRLANAVETEPTPKSLPRKGKQKTVSEKPIYDRDGDNKGYSKHKAEEGSPMSEEVMSEKIIYGKTGHAKINNNSISNIAFEKEQEYYHQCTVPDDKKPVPFFSLEQAKDIMRYDDLRCNALAWGELKTKLGHFPAPHDKMRYIRRVIEVLDEAARQVQEKLNSAQERQRVVAVLESAAFTDFFDEVLDRWDEIRSVKGYVRAALNNMLK